jgi:hypothetical protein
VGTDLDTLTPSELKAIIREQTAIIEAERVARIAAEERARQSSTAASRAMFVLRNPDLGAVNETAFAIALDLNARIANGEEPTEHGYRAPAKRYAEMTGKSESTVAKHMRILSNDPNDPNPKNKGMGLFAKYVIKMPTERETEREIIDQETGEIQTRREVSRGERDANFIEVPGGDIVGFIERMATYRRPDDARKHGGKRDSKPVCEDHPDAGTITVLQEHIECAHCHMILEQHERDRKYFPPEEPGCSGSIMLSLSPPPTTVVTSLYRDSMMASEPVELWRSSSADPGTGDAFSSGLNQCLDCGGSTRNTYRCADCIERARRHNTECSWEMRA